MGSVSMPQGKGSFMHNNRDYDEKQFPENIDRSRSHENIIYRHCESLDKAYKEIFGEALQEYNGKQKRADRKIKNYLTQIENSKNGEKPFYEDVLQWGKMSDFIEHPELREVARDCLLEYISTFEERNPNLKLIGAYIHMDEASPHLHFDYVPVADGYKSGLSVRNSLTKAMNAMGYGLDVSRLSKKDNATSQWKNAERSYFASICQSRGLVVDPERHNEQEEKYTVREYKEIVRSAEKKAEQIISRADEVAKQQIKAAYSENLRLMARNDKLQSKADTLSSEITDKEKEVAELDNDVVHKQSLIKGLDKFVQSRRDTIDEYNEKISDLVEQKKTLESDIEVKNFFLRDCELSIASKEKYIKELRDSKDELTSEVYGLDREVKEKRSELSGIEVQINDCKGTLESVEHDIYSKELELVTLSDDVKGLESKKKDLESLIGALNENIDKFFKNVIGTFRRGLSEAREIALKGAEPETPKKAIDRVNKAEERATTSLDSMRTDRVSVRAKLEEKKAEVKENVKAEASAERDTIQQITRRRRGR